MGFVVEDFFEITGRGSMVTRSEEAAWADSERYSVGDLLVCDGLSARIAGIEKFAVPDGHPANRTQQSLLLRIGPDRLALGQEWTRLSDARQLHLARIAQLGDDDLESVVRVIERTIAWGDGWLQRQEDGRLRARDTEWVVITEKRP